MSLRSRLNLVIVQALIISLMLALGGRLFYLQVAEGLTYQDAALSACNGSPRNGYFS